MKSNDVRTHFAARAPRYDKSSHWCGDEGLRRRVLELLKPRPTDVVLDVACGTGLVSSWFRPLAGRVVGVDLTPEMLRQASERVVDSVLGDAHALPFATGRFDLTICRQGVQFMDAEVATSEMFRVVRPGGRICLVSLCAYGERDQAEFFEALRLRNPARKNFFVRGDAARLLTRAGCVDVVEHEYVTQELVEAWADNGAIESDAVRRISALYESASPDFRYLHALRRVSDGWIDNMLMAVAVGTRPGTSPEQDRANAPLGYFLRCPSCSTSDLTEHKSSWCCQQCGGELPILNGVVGTLNP